MSTRGHVAIKENGKYKYIYNHHDSYIDGLGITLYKYYKDVNKVKELIALGNTSSIGSTVEEGGSKTYKEHLDKPLEQRGTVAAFRDINRWKDCSEKVTWDEVKPKEAEYLADVFGQEFTYIFDVEETRWYFAYWGDDNSWIVACGIIKLITMCFGLTFKWSIATGIWLIICILRSVFNVTVKK